MKYDERIAELEAELARLRREQDDEARARRDAVPPRYEYLLVPVNPTHDKVADPSCRYYRLEGVVINADELHAVGAKVPQSGGMNYLFNTLSGRFVLSVGGGYVHLYLVDQFGRKAESEAFRELEILLHGAPEATHDVTDIVERAHAKREAQVL